MGHLSVLTTPAQDLPRDSETRPHALRPCRGSPFRRRPLTRRARNWTRDNDPHHPDQGLHALAPVGRRDRRVLVTTNDEGRLVVLGESTDSY